MGHSRVEKVKGSEHIKKVPGYIPNNLKLIVYFHFVFKIPTQEDRFGLVWHINHWKLFNAKSSLYICIKYIRFGLV